MQDADVTESYPCAVEVRTAYLSEKPAYGPYDVALRFEDVRKPGFLAGNTKVAERFGGCTLNADLCQYRFDDYGDVVRFLETLSGHNVRCTPENYLADLALKGTVVESRAVKKAPLIEVVKSLSSKEVEKYATVSAPRTRYP